jgi:hypothetical protein
MLNSTGGLTRFFEKEVNSRACTRGTQNQDNSKFL